MRLVLRAATAVAAIVWAVAVAAAAPFSCTESAIGSDAFLSYQVDRFDRVADLGGYFETSRPAECGTSFTGRLNTVTGTGIARFNQGGQYRLSLTGDLGSSYLDDPDIIEEVSSYRDGDVTSAAPPPYRLDFRPLGGSPSDFLFPGGISIAFACMVTDDCGPEPFFLILAREIDGRTIPFLISNDGRTHSVSALDPVAAVPLPATLPLVGAALLGLGGLGWRRQRSS